MARFGFAEQFFDNAGDPLSGGKLYFYETGTTTPKTTYSDEAETIANTNPVVLDAAGRMGDVFFTGDAKLVITDSDDVTMETVDPVTGDSLSAAEIKTSYESNSNTNAYTDAEKTKLAGIEASADVTDATNVIAALDGASIPSITSTASDKIVLQDASGLDDLGVDTIANVLALATYSFDYSTLADNEYDGITFPAFASSGGVPAHHPVRRSGTSPANSVSPTGSIASELVASVIGISLNTATATSESIDVLLYGFVRDTSWTWTDGAPIYINAVGDLTETRPTTGGTWACRVGIAVDSDIIFVNPQVPIPN